MKIFFIHGDVEKFILSLEKQTIIKITRTLELLETFGNRLEMPHSKQIGAGMFELRIRGTQEVRLLYTFHKQTAIILCGFLKKSINIPRTELKRAIQRKKSLDVV